MGPRASLDRCGKSRPRPGFDPRTIQPVAIRYTDYTSGPTDVVYNQNLIPIISALLAYQHTYFANV